jgi:hypothetical protein
MTSTPVRDQLAGHLLPPQNAALLFIDYQPSQLAGSARCNGYPFGWVDAGQPDAVRAVLGAAQRARRLLITFLASVPPAGWAGRSRRGVPRRR